MGDARAVIRSRRGGNLNVRLLIDKLVVEGFDLSPHERTRLESTLRIALKRSLNERLHAHIPATRRNALHEHVSVAVPVASTGQAIGQMVARALVNKAWATPEAPTLSRDRAGRVT